MTNFTNPMPQEIRRNRTAKKEWLSVPGNNAAYASYLEAKKIADQMQLISDGIAQIRQAITDENNFKITAYVREFAQVVGALEDASAGICASGVEALREFDAELSAYDLPAVKSGQRIYWYNI